MVIKLDGLSEKEKKAQLEFAFLYPKSFELIKQEGRVEGAIAELKAILHLLDELEGMNFSANWYKRQIELRVKELLGGKK